MQAYVRIALITVAVIGSGCATTGQQPINLGPEAITAQSGRVGVMMTALPTVGTYLPGAECPRCILTASGANATLTAHAKTLSYEDLLKLKDDVADFIRRKVGTDAVVVIPDTLSFEALPKFAVAGRNLAESDFSPLRQKYQIEKLIVIQISQLGMRRTYSSYFATSDPKAVLSGRVFLVNLGSNLYEWYRPLEVIKAADGRWDEPPKFPGLTRAFSQVVAMGRDTVLADLTRWSN